MASYLTNRRRFKVLKSVLIGEKVAIGSVMSDLDVSQPKVSIAARSDLCRFLGPLLLCIRTLMMIGNWGQHAFVCPEQPDNAYRASIVCVNTRYNHRRCFNERISYPPPPAASLPLERPCTRIRSATW